MTMNPENAKHAPWASPLPQEWDQAMDEYLRTRRRAGQPASSLSAYQTHLGHLGRRVGVGPWELTEDQLAEYVDAQRWGNETRRGRRQTILNFYRWAQAKGYVQVSPVTEYSLPKVKTEKRKPRPAPDAAYHTALAAADPREALMLRLAAELGMRRAEVAVVHTDDLLQDYSGGFNLTIHGKGAKDRILPVPASLAATISAYPRGFLFPGRADGHLSPRWVGRRIADLIPQGFTMHTLRHRFGTRSYAKTRDLVFVQEAMGHESPETTRRYVDFDRSRMRGILEELAAS